jgi:hypothetical protein
MKFIADENFPLPSIKRLRQPGHDVAAVITDSPGGADEEILARAVREGRIVLGIIFGREIHGRGGQTGAPASVVLAVCGLGQ